MRAIDLYSGIGGWTVGLNRAGIEVVAAYEKWQPAIDTYNANNGHEITSIDIRSLELDLLPKNIDVVVGSPPCTQFSLSNRGGSGDLADGMVDIRKFLEIVDALRPSFWVMENVPRVEKILKTALFSDSGSLREFAHLFPNGADNIRSLNLAEYGLPQKRKRCLAGNFPLELLLEYSQHCPERTLGCVMDALNQEQPQDPVYGIGLDRRELTDHKAELAMTEEEVRLNAQAKCRHPVYNAMSFPDILAKPARTVTATCTKVSRESIVIESGANMQNYRRLTIRERLCLQSFPISFQLFAKGYSQKIKMAGNALPPLIAYYVACAIRGTEAKDLRHPDQLERLPVLPSELANCSKPEGRTTRYPEGRRFRGTIPNLHFKSGIRFEIQNSGKITGGPSWAMTFTYGTPSNIKHLSLDKGTFSIFQKMDCYHVVEPSLQEEMDGLRSALQHYSPKTLQETWSRRSKNILTPFTIVDAIDAAIPPIIDTMNGIENLVIAELRAFLLKRLKLRQNSDLKSVGLNDTKLQTYGPNILVGVLLGCQINELVLGTKRAILHRPQSFALVAAE